MFCGVGLFFENNKISYKNMLTYGLHKYKIIMGYKIKGGDIVSPKTGRPTDNPKGNPIHIRLDDECNSILEKYCEQTKLSRAGAIRIGIKKLESDIKK